MLSVVSASLKQGWQGTHIRNVNNIQTTHELREQQTSFWNCCLPFRQLKEGLKRIGILLESSMKGGGYYSHEDFSPQKKMPHSGGWCGVWTSSRFIFISQVIIFYFFLLINAFVNLIWFDCSECGIAQLSLILLVSLSWSTLATSINCLFELVHLNDLLFHQ